MRQHFGNLYRMLPHGFHWNDAHDRLQLRDCTLICIDPGYSPISLINTMRSRIPRALFFSTHEIAIRYSETWVAKWESNIRLHVGNIERIAAIESIRAAASGRVIPVWTRTEASPPMHGERRKAVV